MNESGVVAMCTFDFRKLPQTLQHQWMMGRKVLGMHPVFQRK